ncbi:hypothetical protein AA0120_g3979 [Alternaria tenuissima]|nr:hypothetical protein AA0120_g3979 [Alternaria tenuissima]
MAVPNYETIMWEKEMKEQILSHARILYADKITPTSILDVISTESSDQSYTSYTSYIIMIEAPGSTAYKALRRTKRKDSVGDGLITLLRYLRLRLTRHLGMSGYT